MEAGNSPVGQLTRDSHGNLFGATQRGGGRSGGSGTVFELEVQEKGGWTEKILYGFTAGNSDGQYPWAGLVLDNQGHLYGTTLQGGIGACCGTVYEITP
jgi:uncharacterized repeat protein (TIGR03803 family)